MGCAVNEKGGTVALHFNKFVYFFTTGRSWTLTHTYRHTHLLYYTCTDSNTYTNVVFHWGESSYQITNL